MASQIRLIVACGLFSAWMILLFTGWVWGGAVHLVLALSFYLFPWRMTRQRTTRQEHPAAQDATSDPSL